ncbi:hypothetical protein E3P92_01009 [Wallemia ichthyophaga]|nr:hypothetical protein E3P92_01009 [Wallemia ichthyophaga]
MSTKYSNFNLLKVEDIGDSDSDDQGDQNPATPPKKSTKVHKHSDRHSNSPSKRASKQQPQQPQLDFKVDPVYHKAQPGVEQKPQPVHKSTPVHKQKPVLEQKPEPIQQPVHKSQQPQQPQQPSQTQSIPAKPSKKQAIVTRTIWTFIMVFGFFGCLMAGHAWLIMLVMLCQSLSYREVTALFGFKTEYGVRAKNSEKDRWSTILNWYFFVVTNYFLYGESIIYYLKHIIFADVYFIQLAKHHRFISFMLYIIGFMGFVANLKRSFLKRQFVLFCWVHMSLLLIVLSSHFIVNNILEGIIWFWVPASLVICNDIFAYVFGMLFGKTPLIALSPKKTVEGFIGGGIATVLFAWGWGTIFQQWKYMICPVHDLGTSIFSQVECVPNPVFIWREFEIPSMISALLSTMTQRDITIIPYTPFQIHCLFMATFASVVAPFGGFFASGFKRAFDIKDFGDSIPGHGGLTDRMDCQFLMGLFAYVYYSSLIREAHVSAGQVLQTIVSSLRADEQLELFSDFKNIAVLLSQSLQLGPQRKQAEQQLQQGESQAGFLLLLLQLLGQENAPNEIRLAAAVLLKNNIRKNWPEDTAISVQDRNTVKAQIVPAMIALSSRPPLQAQLGEAVAIIAEHDFPANWDGLIDQLVAALTESDYSINNGVLTTAHSIFKRWRSQFRTDDLFREIIYVLERFCEPFLGIFRRTDHLLSDPSYHSLPEAQRVQLAQAMILLTQIYHDLNSQDLPPFFEDNNNEFMGYFAKYLVEWNAQFDDGGGEDPTPLEKIRASICEIVELYSQRYLDAFPQMGAFVERVWTLVIGLGQSTKYDVLISKALKFLSTVVRNPDQRGAIDNEATLNQFCEKIILPNMQMREHEEEMFEDDPLEYVRRDLEPTSDSDTRRSAATEFTRALMEQFESTITTIIKGYIANCLQVFSQQNWKAKDTAIYLLTSIASKGSTSSHGVSSTNQLIDVISFFSEHVFQHLQNPSHPILEVDAIKFLYTFRNQLSKEQILSVLPLLVRHLGSENYVVYSYAAITLERTLALRRDGKQVIEKDDVRIFAQDILVAIFNKIGEAPTPEKKAENEYLARAAMRIILVAQDSLSDVHEAILDYLVGITTEISKNPSNPRFSQYIFEAIAALVRFVGGTHKQLLPNMTNKLLYGPFQMILGQDVQEFQPFVFQIVAQLLEIQGEGTPDAFKPLLAPLMQPTLWEQRGNVPPLVRLLKAFLLRVSEDIVANNQISNILGVFQKLIGSKVQDVYGFELLEGLIENVPAQTMQDYIAPVLTLLLTRLQASKTDQFTRAFIHFFMLTAALDDKGYGVPFLVSGFDKVQPGLLPQVLQSVLLPEVQKVTQRDRKVVYIGLVKLLTNTQTIQMGKVWSVAMESLLKLFINPQDLKAAGTNEILVDDESGYQTTYARLASSDYPPADRFPSVTDERSFMSSSLDAFSRNVPGQIPPLLQGIPNELLSPLVQFMQSNGQTIV